MATLTQRTSQDIKSRATQLPVQVTGTQAMASKMWTSFIAMGFMIVMVAFVYGLVNSSVSADYFQFSKETREAAVAGSDLATQRKPSSNPPKPGCRLQVTRHGNDSGGRNLPSGNHSRRLSPDGGRVQESFGVPVTIIKAPMTAKVFTC
jgi:hypothetical protein